MKNSNERILGNKERKSILLAHKAIHTHSLGINFGTGGGGSCGVSNVIGTGGGGGGGGITTLGCDAKYRRQNNLNGAKSVL